MDIALRDRFLDRWAKYFGPAELPICFYYTDESALPIVPGPAEQTCLIGQLVRARRGEDLCFGRQSVGCFGASRYLGFDTTVRENFELFLSCGIPGKLAGERYKKTPEIVREMVQAAPVSPAPGKYVVFKRWDRLIESDEPAVVAFFARPDVLSGLFTLAGFDQSELNTTVAPMGAGCATIVQYPLAEAQRDVPRAVLGMFDVSARPCVSDGLLTFAVPMARFEQMVANMDESFLITDSWAKVRRRIDASV